MTVLTPDAVYADRFRLLHLIEEDSFGATWMAMRERERRTFRLLLTPPGTLPPDTDPARLLDMVRAVRHIARAAPHLEAGVDEEGRGWLATDPADDMGIDLYSFDIACKRTAVERLIAEEDARRAADPPAIPEDEQAVAPGDWAVFLDELRGPSGRPEVTLRLEASRAIAGGVEWTLPAPITRRAARAIVEAMLKAARATEGVVRVGDGGIGVAIANMFGRGGERRFRTFLENLGIRGPVRAEHYRSYFSEFMEREYPGELRAGLDERGLTLEYTYETWITSHDREVISQPFAHVPKAALPFAEADFRALVAAIGEARNHYRDYPVPPEDHGPRICKYCGLEGGPLDMHDRHTCHSCAERYLGVIH